MALNMRVSLYQCEGKLRPLEMYVIKQLTSAAGRLAMVLTTHDLALDLVPGAVPVELRPESRQGRRSGDCGGQGRRKKERWDCWRPGTD
jgi:hypothetical protein